MLNFTPAYVVAAWIPSVQCLVHCFLPEPAFLHLYEHQPSLDRTLHLVPMVGGTVTESAAAGADVALDVCELVPRACCSALGACGPVPHRDSDPAPTSASSEES